MKSLPLGDLLHQRRARSPNGTSVVVEPNNSQICLWRDLPCILIRGLSNLALHLTDVKDDILGLCGNIRSGEESQ